MTSMSEFHLRLFFLSLLLFCCVSPSSFFTLNNLGLVACGPHQIQAFTQFKNEFDTRGCNHSDNSNGIWCDKLTGAVTQLRLTACVSGTLKPNSSLFGFHQLRYVDINNNNLASSSLPSEFGNLSKLQVLSLYSNGFLGQVPSSFSNLSLLYFLDLSYNQFSGNLDSNSTIFGLHHLSYLNLAFNNFSSSLPSEIGNLYRLEALSLSSNRFYGQVPLTVRAAPSTHLEYADVAALSNLTRLTELYLDQNTLSGSFPLVQNLTRLSTLDLAYNNFSGPIPSSLLTMPFLSHLILNNNHLTGSIEFPNSSSSSQLKSLFLGNNHFEVKILEPISKLINLKNLDLSYLNISQPYDLNLFSSLKYLVRLELSGNRILPASLCSDSYLPLTLESLSLERCDIRQFPNILKTLQKLEYINLSHNRIKGKIPELPLSIQVFSVGNNSFSGEVPLSICNRSSLVVLDLSLNNFTGPIPHCISNFKFVLLRNNNFTGSIPNAFFAGASLQSLDVGYNRLTKKLPRSLLNCSSLQFLSVDNNGIKDTFPFWLKDLPSLKILTLRSNNFYGPISPPHQGPLGFPELRILEISGNKFTGSLPPSYFMNWKASSLTMAEDESLYMIHGEVGYKYMDFIDLHYKGLSMERNRILTSYAAIDFSGNKLEGQIPESIGLLKALIALNLSNNAFTGQIPLSFANLKRLESLDLSSNKLSGTIPNGLGSLSFLGYINVSHNELSGLIPQGTQIMGQPKSSFEGNARLCGLPLEENCFGSNASPTQQREEEEEEEDEQEEVVSWKAVAIGSGFGVLFGLALAQVTASYKPEWLAKIIGPSKRSSR